MFGSFGWMELLLILVIVLIIFGAGKIPQLGEGLGKAIKGFKKSVHEADAIDVTATEAEPHALTAVGTDPATWAVSHTAACAAGRCGSTATDNAGVTCELRRRTECRQPDHGSRWFGCTNSASARNTMFGLGAGEILIILVIAFLLFGPKQLPEIGRQVGKAVKGFKETADDLKKTVEPELNMIQQEMKMVEQDFESSMKEAEEEINHGNIGRRAWGRGIGFAQAGLIPFFNRSTAVKGGD